eukprot:gene5505-biopygen5513
MDALVEMSVQRATGVAEAATALLAEVVRGTYDEELSHPRRCWGRVRRGVTWPWTARTPSAWKRDVIYKEVSDNFPELLGLTESCFRHQAHLGWQGADGQQFRWVDSAGGAQQGDPLGPFFMAVALQPVLRATLSGHPDVYVMAYLDDIHLLGPPDVVRAAYDTIVPLLGAMGMELNVAKSTVFCPDGACPEFADVVDDAGTPMPAQRLAPAGWLGSWAQVWGRMVVLFPAFGGMLPKDIRCRTEGLRVPEEAPVWGGFGTSQPMRQQELSNYRHGSDWLRLFDAANSPVRARLLSLSRDGATAHLNALPHDGGFRMQPTATVIALCLQLGVSIPLVREVSAVGTGRCACGEEVDCFGYDYLACNRRGRFTYRHDAVQDVLYEMLCKRTVTYCSGGGAATYGDVSPHKLVAFAIEAFSGLGLQAKQLLQDCERRRQERLGPEMASATWSTPTFASYWGQRIMVALHGAQTFGLHGRALEDYPQPDITVLNYDGRGRHLIIDVVVGFPCAQSYVEEATSVPFHTAAVAERCKAETYGDVSPHKSVAFAIEAFGGLGVQAKQLLQDCAVTHPKFGCWRPVYMADWSGGRTSPPMLKYRRVTPQILPFGRGTQSAAVPGGVAVARGVGFSPLTSGRLDGNGERELATQQQLSACHASCLLWEDQVGSAGTPFGSQAVAHPKPSAAEDDDDE